MSYFPPRYDVFLQQIRGTLVVRAGLLDVSDSSRATYLAAASARLLDELSYQTVQQQLSWNIDTASGSDLDRRASEQSAGNIVRLGATRASGSVVFYTLSPGASIVIPSGTEVLGPGGVSFGTTVDATLSPSSSPQIGGHTVGQDSGLVPIEASLAGLAGNVAARSIVGMGQRPTGIDGVQNPSATLYGQDVETDDSLRNRVRSYAASLSRGTPNAIVGAVLGAQDPISGARIQFASLVAVDTQPGLSRLYIDDGTGQVTRTATVSGELLTQGLSGPGGVSAAGGETDLYLGQVPIDIASPPTLTSSVRGPLAYNTDFRLDPLNGHVFLMAPLAQGEEVTASYTAYTGLLALGQKIVDGDPHNETQFPGYAAAGTRIEVLAPQTISVSLAVICAVDPAFDAVATRAAVQSVLVGYVNGLGIGAPVQIARMTTLAMSVAGMRNFTPTAPTQDVFVLSSQLARTDPSRVRVS
jgi:uncharacterized phage protein gp47/JayE